LQRAKPLGFEGANARVFVLEMLPAFCHSLLLRLACLKARLILKWHFSDLSFLKMEKAAPAHAFYQWKSPIGISLWSLSAFTLMQSLPHQHFESLFHN
jgi:hypothetical protein